jgi:hypothetical protein
MTEEINLKEIERKAWTSYFEDGLWEFFFGALFLLGGIRSLTNNASYTLLLLVPILILPVGKKLITIPRLGHVKFGPARKLKQRRVIAVLTISVLATLLLLLPPHSGLSLAELPISPIMAGWIAVVFGLIAYYLGFRRLFAYGLLYALSELLWGQFGEPIGPIVQAISGIVILLVGVVVLTRFVRRYPLPSEAALDVQG